jgi:hypothetical protein
VVLLGLSELVDEVEARSREGKELSLHGVALGQRVGNGVRRARLVLDGEVEAQQLANPVVLRNGGQALVQQILQAVVIRLDCETAPLEVWPPVAHSLDQTNELTLVGCQGLMSRCHRTAEKAIGCPSWMRTTPNPWDDVSHSTTKGLSKAGITSIDAEVTPSLRARKVEAASAPHAKPSFLSSAVSGAAMEL